MIAQIEANDYKLRVQQSEAALGQARARLGLSPDGTDDKVSAEQTGTVRQAKAQLDAHVREIVAWHFNWRVAYEPLGY